jgi:hypothetical protein
MFLRLATLLGVEANMKDKPIQDKLIPNQKGEGHPQPEKSNTKGQNTDADNMANNRGGQTNRGAFQKK